MRSVAVAGPLQLGSPIAVIKDLAVIDDPARGVFIRHGLCAGGQIDDAQAAVAETYLRLAVIAKSIRPAMGQDAGHAFNDAVRIRMWKRSGVTGDAAHDR